MLRLLKTQIFKDKKKQSMSLYTNYFHNGILNYGSSNGDRKKLLETGPLNMQN